MKLLALTSVTLGEEWTKCSNLCGSGTQQRIDCPNDGISLCDKSCNREREPVLKVIFQGKVVLYFSMRCI